MIQEAHPDVYVTVGMVDEGLTSTGIVVPGLGDPGDRLFETCGNDSDLVVPPEKRKRSNSTEGLELMKKVKEQQQAQQS